MKYRIHKETLFDLARYAAETGFCGALNDWLEEQTGANHKIEQCVFPSGVNVYRFWGSDAIRSELRGPNVNGEGLCMNYPESIHWDVLQLNPETGYYEGDWSDENM